MRRQEEATVDQVKARASELLRDLQTILTENFFKMINRKELLASALREAAIKAQEEQDLQRQIARVTADVHARLAQHKAETSQSLSCPSCGAPLPEGWRTDPVTGDSTENDDDSNEGDGADGADQDDDEFDNRQPVKPMSGLTRDQILASLNKIRC